MYGKMKSVKMLQKGISSRGSPGRTMLITSLNSFSRVLFWTFQKAETLKAGNFLISTKTLFTPLLLS
ncbi:MAG: hypothetical protein ACE5HY_04060 [Candidatus Hydrothermarchaeales archaeon]